MAGELVTADWQFEYLGIQFGDGTDTDVTSIEGLNDLPELVTSDRARLRRHGMYQGDDFASSRTVTLAFESNISDGDRSGDEIMRSVMELTRPGLDESPLHFQVPGVAEGGKRFVNVRARRRSIPINKSYYWGYAQGTVEFVATDPRIYDATPSLALTALPDGGGGLLFPAEPPFTFVTSSDTGDVTATNEGTFQVNPVIRIDGPVTNPTVENLADNGKTIKLNATIAAGAYYLIDTESRSVLLNGTASRYNELDPTSEWWHLEPGANTIRFRSDTNTEDAVLTVAFNSAWL